MTSFPIPAAADPRAAHAPSHFSVDLSAGSFVTSGHATGMVGDADSMGGHGIHVAWHWNGAELTVRSDRYGMCPAFVWVRPAGISIAPRLDTLLALGAPRELDHGAIGIFARLGYYIEQDTPFRHIRALPPGCEGRWTRDGWEVRGRWPIVPAERRARPALVRRFAELLEEAVRAALTPGRRIIHPLSGGHDSRHLLFAMLAVGARPERALTYGTWEVPVAARVAAHLGVPHEVVPLVGTIRDAELRKDRMTWWMSDEHNGLSQLALAIDRLDPAREALVLDGLAGGMLSEGPFLSPERESCAATQDWAGLARLLMPPSKVEMLHPDVRASTRYEDAVERLTESLRGHAGAANPVSSWLLANRTRREIALSPFVLIGAERARTPWLQPDLFDLLASIPLGELRDWNLQEEAIAHAYPDATALPYSTRQPARSRTRIGSLVGNVGEIRFARDTLRHMAARDATLLHYPSVALRIGASLVSRRRRRSLREFCNRVVLLDDLDRVSRVAASSVTRARRQE